MKLDNKNVKSLVDSIYRHYGEIISLALNSYKKSNGKKYKLMLEQYRAGDTQFQETYNTVIKKQLESFLNSENAVFPNFKGMDLQEFQSSTIKDTTDIVTMRKEVFEVTAQALKLPLSMMYGNITNMNEIVKVYLSICIDPLSDMISEELTRKYFTFEEWEKGSYIKVDTSRIHHADILDVADKVDKAIASGVASIDDMRNRLGMPLLNTDFSTSHFITKNYALAEEILNIQLEGGE